MNRKTEIMAGLLALTLFVSAVTIPPQFRTGTQDNLTDRSSVTGQTGPGLTRSDSLKTDPETGLVIDNQLTLVKGQCTACHSSKLILQSHFPREKWIERIRWMQRTQNLWDLGESEPAILAYLTKHYGPAEGAFDGRREPLNAGHWHKLSN